MISRRDFIAAPLAIASAGALLQAAPKPTGVKIGCQTNAWRIDPANFDTAWTTEGPAAVFVAVDHHSAECVGLHASRQGTRFEALEPLRQGVREHFGGFAQEIAAGLSVRHDHGSQWHGPSRMSCVSLGSRVRLLSCGRRKGMAVRSGLSAR